LYVKRMKEKDMIACCGLDCEECGAFIATRNNDDRHRAKVAEEWSKLYGASLKPEQINCTGCRSRGVKFHYCDNMCEVRKCAMGKGLENCASCDAFACSQLEEIFRRAPQARETLESLRAK
jgi:hypothetical protein